MDEILHLEKEFKSKIDQSDNLQKIEQIKSEAFGKSGKIGELFKKITTLQGEDRKNFASNLNKLKDNINNLINSKINLFEQKEINKKLSEDRIDVTLPGRPVSFGKIHPVTQVIDEVTAIFGEIGFSGELGSFFVVSSVRVGDAGIARLRQAVLRPRCSSGKKKTMSPCSRAHRKARSALPEVHTAPPFRPTKAFRSAPEFM